MDAVLFLLAAAILVALYGLWQFVGSRALIGAEHGVDRGRRLWEYERDLHLRASYLRHPMLVAGGAL